MGPTPRARCNHWRYAPSVGDKTPLENLRHGEPLNICFLNSEETADRGTAGRLRVTVGSKVAASAMPTHAAPRRPKPSGPDSTSGKTAGGHLVREQGCGVPQSLVGQKKSHLADVMDVLLSVDARVLQGIPGVSPRLTGRGATSDWPTGGLSP